MMFAQVVMERVRGVQPRGIQHSRRSMCAVGNCSPESGPLASALPPLPGLGILSAYGPTAYAVGCILRRFAAGLLRLRGDELPLAHG